MIGIHPISPSYPIKKPNKIDREKKQESDKQPNPKSQKKEKEDSSNDLSEQHIDEIV